MLFYSGSRTNVHALTDPCQPAFPKSPMITVTSNLWTRLKRSSRQQLPFPLKIPAESQAGSVSEIS